MEYSSVKTSICNENEQSIAKFQITDIDLFNTSPGFQSGFDQIVLLSPRAPFALGVLSLQEEDETKNDKQKDNTYTNYILHIRVIGISFLVFQTLFSLYFFFILYCFWKLLGGWLLFLSNPLSQIPTSNGLYWWNNGV